MPRTYSFDHYTAVPSGLVKDLPRQKISRPKTGGAPAFGAHVPTETESLWQARGMLVELERVSRGRKRKASAPKKKRATGRKTVRTKAAAKKRRVKRSGKTVSRSQSRHRK